MRANSIVFAVLLAACSLRPRPIARVPFDVNAIVLAAPRLLFAMAEQGQLPAMISLIHRRFHTPHVALFISAAGMLVLTLWRPRQRSVSKSSDAKTRIKSSASRPTGRRPRVAGTVPSIG